MVRNAKLPDAATIMEHRNAGMSNQQIGEKYGVTAEAVRLALKRHGVELPRLRHNHARYIPWHIRADHANDALARRLRILSKQQQGVPLDEREQQTLDDFLSFMNGANPHGLELSVHYSRTDAEGFWLEAKRPGDRDYISPPANPRSR